MRHRDRLRASPVGSLASHPERWIWGAVLLSVLVCASIAWLHLRHRQALARATATLAVIREARIELAKGFLTASLAGDPGSPFERDQGLALLRQAMSSFDRALADVGPGEKESSAAFRDSVLAFQGRLTAWGQMSVAQPGREASLRIAFHDLERQADRLDLQAQENLRRLVARLDVEFLVALGVAALLLAGVCVVVFLAERAKEQSEEDYRQLFEVGSDCIFLIDNASGRVLQANQAACVVYGYSREELLALRNTDLSAEPEQTQQVTRETPTVAARVIFIPFRRHKKKDGTEFPVEITGRFFLKDGRAVHIAAIRDITERGRAEEERLKLQAQLAQAQKMESVGRLAGGVAHDFNNALGVILGHAEMAMMKAPVDRVHRDLEKIREAALRSADLTRQLLAFARRQAIAPKVLDLNDAVTGMLKMLRPLIGEDIDLAWMPGAALWPIRMDPTQIHQVMTNLLVNARDAIGGVGKVVIATRNITADEAYCPGKGGLVPGRYVLLAVSDDGCGMGEEVIEHLFEPFFTTKAVGEGTGLGLATVYGVVKQNHGSIAVYSEPGRGTTFEVYLPAAAEAAPASREGAHAEEEPRGRGETILLVEDETALLEIAAQMLTDLGYSVLAAETPDKALDVARRHGKIHLLITDVVMPEVNGRELASRVEAIHPGIRCLFTSGYTADAIAHRGVLDEGLRFLQKPFARRTLAVKVRQAIQG